MNIKNNIGARILVAGMIFALIPFFAFAQTAVSPQVSAKVPDFLVLASGSHGIPVEALQLLLIHEGYLHLTPTAVTGYFGSLTRSAVKAFQKANNLQQTGVFTIASSSLKSFFAPIASSAFTSVGVGTSGMETQSIQGFLISRGYLHIATSTGYFGSLTQSAVKAFQAAKGLPQTGLVDSATFAAMNQN